MVRRAPEGGQCFLGARETRHIVAAAGEEGLRDVEQRAIVIDEEDTLVPDDLDDLDHLLERRIGFTADRQIDLENTALADAARDGDDGIVIAQDTVHRRQTEAGSRPHLLGREERLENAHHRRAVHAAAGIGDRDAAVTPGIEHPDPHARPAVA